MKKIIILLFLFSGMGGLYAQRASVGVKQFSSLLSPLLTFRYRLFPLLFAEGYWGIDTTASVLDLGAQVERVLRRFSHFQVSAGGSFALVSREKSTGVALVMLATAELFPSSFRSLSFSLEGGVRLTMLSEVGVSTFWAAGVQWYFD